jgi:hypothetical protein
MARKKASEMTHLVSQDPFAGLFALESKGKEERR